MKKLTDSQKTEIIQLYKSGITPKIIGQQFGIRNNSVCRIARNEGIKCNQLIRVSKEKRQYIIEQYISGMSSTLIAAQLDIDDSTVCRIIKRNGGVIRPAEENKRKYKIDTHYFDVIDTEEKAYHLGFLYADGNLSVKGSTIKICIHPQDRDVLQKFSHAIYGFEQITIGEPTILKDGSEVCYITTAIYCATMWRTLNKLGCPPKKSFDIRMPTPDQVPLHLLRDFIRGYFDGDGCISLRHPTADFSSNAIFVGQLRDYLLTQGLSVNKVLFDKENPLSGFIQITGWDHIKRLYNYMYDGATIYMSRKYLIWQEFLRLHQVRIDKKSSLIDSADKYGTTYIHKWNDIPIRGNEFSQLSLDDKEAMIDCAFKFYRAGGFPYPILTNDEIIKNFASLQNTNVSSIEIEIDGKKVLRNDNQNGNKITMHFAPHFFDVKSGIKPTHPSMKETFDSDKLFLDVIRNRLCSNFNLCGNMLRQGLANSKLAFKASIFNTVIAKAIYSKFSKEGDIIYDYSMGFGQRLIAALSLPYKLHYIGVDVLQKSVDSNKDIYNFLKDNIPGLNKTTDLYLAGSEDFCDPSLFGKINLAFSSPPYWKVEKYSDDKGRAYSTTYQDFIHQWWKQTVANIDRMLTKEGIFIVNIADYADGFNIGQDMTNIVKERGFQLVDRYYIKLSKNLQFNNVTSDKLEPIHVFKRI